MSDYMIRDAIINAGPTMLIVLFFIIGCALGIDIHKNCAAAKDSKLYNNLREALNYGLTSGIVSLLILLIMNMTKGNASTIGLIFGIFGVVTSGMTIGLFYKCANEITGERKRMLEGFMWTSLIVSVLGGGFSAMMLGK